MTTPTFFKNHLRVRYTFMATHAVLLLFLFLFTLLSIYDGLMFIYHCCSLGFVFIYLIPAAILCWRNRESGYERGWVEMLYITYQVLWSWVCVIWLGFLRDPEICAGTGEYGYTEIPFYTPYVLRSWRYNYDAKRVCDILIVVAVFSALHTAVLMTWFGWTLWLTTKVAKTMGEPWDRNLVLKQVSMGKMAKLHHWREGEEAGVGMGKIRSESPAPAAAPKVKAKKVKEPKYQPHKHNKFNGLMA